MVEKLFHISIIIKFNITTTSVFLEIYTPKHIHFDMCVMLNDIHTKV